MIHVDQQSVPWLTGYFIQRSYTVPQIDHSKLQRETKERIQVDRTGKKFLTINFACQDKPLSGEEICKIAAFLRTLSLNVKHFYDNCRKKALLKGAIELRISNTQKDSGVFELRVGIFHKQDGHKELCRLTAEHFNLSMVILENMN